MVSSAHTHPANLIRGGRARSGVALASLATLLALWLGLTAPSVSPVAVMPIAQLTTVTDSPAATGADTPATTAPPAAADPRVNQGGRRR